VLLLCALVALVLAGRASAQNKKMKLEVLPKTLSNKEVKNIMKGWAQSLGVKCDFCHDLLDFSKDTEHKTIARGMVKMVNDINTKHLAKYKVGVTCATCHRGNAEPVRPPGAPPLHPEEGGEEGAEHQHEQGAAPATPAQPGQPPAPAPAQPKKKP